MPLAPYVLLPPSETKQPGGRHRATPGFFDARLSPPRDDVKSALSRLLDAGGGDVLTDVLKVRGTLAPRAVQSTQELLDGGPLRPAWQRFTGVVWSHLDPATLTPSQRRRLLIPSAAYGWSRGDDVVSDFRLTFKVSLGDLGPLGSFWRPHLTEALEELGRRPLVHLLPQEHADVVTWSRVHQPVIMVAFRDHEGRRTIGHDAKAVKGIVARRVLEHGVDALSGFSWRGWRGSRDGDGFVVIAPPTRQ